MGTESFELTYQLTPADYEAMMESFWRTPPGRRKAVRTLALCAGVFSAYTAWHFQDWIAGTLAVILLSSALMIPMLTSRIYGRYFERQRLGEGDVRFTANAEGIAVRTNLGDQRFPWPSVRRVDETASHFFLWLHQYMAVLVPKSAFVAASDAARFAAFAKERTHGNVM